MHRAAHRISRLTRARRATALAGLLGLVAGAGWLAAHVAEINRPRAALSAASRALPGSPIDGLSTSIADRAPMIGTVEERLSAGSYTYLAVRPDGGSPLWAVTVGGGQPVGTRVSVRSFGRRTDFTSRRLKRTFPTLVFGVVSRAVER